MFIHEAFKQGDLETLLIVLDDPPGFINTPNTDAFGHCLEYAIYHGSLLLIRQLLELSANPNYDGHDVFPSLITALTSEREDTCEIVELLLSFGANIQQRGMNGFTPLHCAAARDNPKAIALLLSHGADPSARTSVDDFTTPIQEAENGGCSEAIRTLRELA